MRTVASFSKPEEAHLFRTRLEAAGIEAFVQDEHLVQMDWLMSNVVGGVRVQVAEELLEAAREFRASEQAYELSKDSRLCERSPVSAEDWPRRLVYLTLLFVMFGLWPLALASVAVLVLNAAFQFGRRRWQGDACDHA